MKKLTAIQTFLGIMMIMYFTGCATRDIRVGDFDNPPPLRKFSDYTHFKLENITIADAYASAEPNIKAKNKIQENIDMRLLPILKAWNDKQNHTLNETMVFEPNIKQIKFIGGAARFWVGAMAGSSAVVMELVCREKSSGKQIAVAEFYQQGNAFGGGLSIGATDNMMLTRIADLVSDYIVNNYESAVGGPTGKPRE